MLKPPSFVAFILGIMIIGATLGAHAQSAPAPAPADHPLSELTRLRLVAAYSKAVLAQQNAQAAQQLAQTAIADWTAMNVRAAKEEKFPEGTVFTVDLAKTGDEVKAVIPPPKTATAAAPKPAPVAPPAPAVPPAPPTDKKK